MMHGLHRMHTLGRTTLALVLCAATAVTGCEGRRTITSTVAPLGLTVRVHVAPDLAAVAQARGWSGAAVPGAVVVAEYTAGDAGPTPSDSAITGATGALRFADLAEGTYTVRVSRTLTAAELTLAGSLLGSTDALAGIATIPLNVSSSDTVDVQLRGVGGSSLVFSEIFGTEPILAYSTYDLGNYVKIYNNSDTTIALAGKLFVDSYAGYVIGANTPYQCSTFAAISNDPAGLWAMFIFRFPPTARALKPGESALIATDAIDHRQVSNTAGFFDLSRADFEFKGTADAQNPLAQGMLDIGPRAADAGDGHGWRTHGRMVIGLAQSLDIDTLPHKFEPALAAGQIVVRIPTAAMLDVASWNALDAAQHSQYTPCPSTVPSNLDAAEAATVVHFADTLSMHRRLIRKLSNGRARLQRSRNSAADWVAAPGTPAAVP